MRSFLGLANQLAGFAPDLSQMTSKLRELLKKGVDFIWLPEYLTAFEKTKELLISDVVLKPFDPDLRTELLTDAAKKKGLGFSLIQRDNTDKPRLIECGSRSLNQAEKNYAVIETQMLGIQWAVRKLRYYLEGMTKFYVVTDHRPLLGVFRKSLGELENARLQRMREKLQDYTFECMWIPGKSHLPAEHLFSVLKMSPLKKFFMSEPSLKMIRS